MKNNLVIAYNGGAYGRYLEWVYNTLISADPIVSPFTKRGNSHNSPYGPGFWIDDLIDHLQTGKERPTVRLHPKTSSSQSIKSNLESVLKHTSQLILMYPDRSHELMCICNYMTKIWSSSDPYDGPMQHVNPADLHRGYGLDPSTDIRTIPLWMRREHMSYYLFDAWHDQVEWYLPERWNDSRVLIITTGQLFDEFENTMTRIATYCGNLKYQRDIADMLPWHAEMISLQPHLGKDQLCENILRAVVQSRDDFEFGELCLTSQAWIQYKLRCLGYEIRCHDLNHFPTDSGHLRTLLYAV